MSQDSSLVQWTTSTGALHLARTAVGSAILSLWLFNCSTSSALNIQISAQSLHVKIWHFKIWYLTGGRAELRHCSLILLSILLLQVMMMVTMTMMIMMVMMITIMMMEILQALAHQATPARQAANHFLGEASTMIQTPNQQSRCIYVRVSIISSIPLIIVFHHPPPPHLGTWSRRLAIVTRELRSMWVELGGSSVQRRWKFERSGHFLLVTTVESSTRKGNDDDNNKQATGKTI